MKVHVRLLIIAAAISGLAVLVFAQSGKKILVAHRGASAYAPEHTIEGYRLAIEQGADFVEQDLQVTKDGALVCLHDLTLERTTDVEEVFPDRFRADVSEDQPPDSRPAKTLVRFGLYARRDQTTRRRIVVQCEVQRRQSPHISGGDRSDPWRGRAIPGDQSA